MKKWIIILLFFVIKHAYGQSQWIGIQSGLNISNVESEQFFYPK